MTVKLTEGLVTETYAKLAFFFFFLNKNYDEEKSLTLMAI